MVEIFDAVRFDVLTGGLKLHRGTKVYLEKLRAILLEKSARDVPDYDVSPEGRYLKEKDN